MNKLNIIKKEVKKILENKKNSHNWEHTERVLNLAIKIAKKEKANIEIVKYAAILHDIAREDEDKTYGRICHAKKGAEKAKKILTKYKIEKDKIEAILHCIRTHRFRGKEKPKTKEAKVLYDADKLDAIGAVGIGRAFLFAGEIGARFYNKSKNILKTKPYSKEDTAYREYMVKLKKIRRNIITRTGKYIANKRHNFMVEFFKRLRKEIKGII